MKFSPIHLALTLPKGHVKEYLDRDWFNSIYFSKLSMYHEQEGYIPILYNFDLQHQGSFEQPIPDSMLMTFYYPEKRMSNLNGIIIIGGQPDIYDAYRTTRTITPYLESLTLDKHGVGEHHTIAVIEQTLTQLAYPTPIRDTTEILERSISKSGDELTSFFPILGDDTYQQTHLALPMDFSIDAVFMLGINEEFFTSTQIGQGIQSMRLYHASTSEIKPSLAFPLIFKWQPVYNDILVQLKKDRTMLPMHYEGQLIPSVIIFDRQHTDQKTALISTIAKYNGTLYYHVAVANSGSADGQPLPLLQAALSREKFGQPIWVDKLDNISNVPQDSIRTDRVAEDQITSQLELVLLETDLTTDGQFDLGKLRSLELKK